MILAEALGIFPYKDDIKEILIKHNFNLTDNLADNIFDYPTGIRTSNKYVSEKNTQKILLKLDYQNTDKTKNSFRVKMDRQGTIKLSVIDGSTKMLFIYTVNDKGYYVSHINKKSQLGTLSINFEPYVTIGFISDTQDNEEFTLKLNIAPHIDLNLSLEHSNKTTDMYIDKDNVVKVFCNTKESKAVEANKITLSLQDTGDMLSLIKEVITIREQMLSNNIEKRAFHLMTTLRDKLLKIESQLS